MDINNSIFSIDNFLLVYKQRKMKNNTYNDLNDDLEFRV